MHAPPRGTEILAIFQVLLGVVNAGLSIGMLAQASGTAEKYVTYVVSGPNATLISSSRSINETSYLLAASDSPDPLVSGSARRLGSALTDGSEHREVIHVSGRKYVAGVRRLDVQFNVTAVILLPWDTFFARVEQSKDVTVGTFTTAVVLWVLFAAIAGACFVRLWKREKWHVAQAKRNASMHRNKQRLLASLSHELRTPMAVVMGLMDELQDEQNSEAAQGSLTLLRKTAADMLHLLDGILMLAKNEAGKSNVETQVFKLRVELEQALAVHAMLVSEGVRTSLSYGSGLTDEVIGDRRKLRQVLDNVLSNAAKFTESGEINVTARRGPDSIDGSNVVEFFVSDTGPGIPPGMEEAVFREFVQAENVRAVHGGTGLGLSIVRSLCRLMGGDVEIASSGPRGTTFKFWIRLVLSGSFKAEDSAASAIDSPAPLKGFHVIVAEDTRPISKLLQRLLTKEGAEATMTADGLELLEAYQAQPTKYSAILMDLQMPNLDGYEATRRIRKMEGEGLLPGRIPIIALTPHAMDSDERECRKVGMNCYLRKPADRGTLLSALLRTTRSSISQTVDTY